MNDGLQRPGEIDNVKVQVLSRDLIAGLLARHVSHTRLGLALMMGFVLIDRVDRLGVGLP
eukprot:663637-Rhodomonas_salina.1